MGKVYKKPEDVPMEIAEAIVDNHIRWYTRLIALGVNGNPSVRIEECQAFKKIWESIKGKGCKFENMSDKEKFEFIDALYDEELIT